MSQRVYNHYFEQWEHHNFKSTIKRIDYYMRNLVRHRDIKTVFVCIEPDIDEMTGKVDPTSNNVHFAWKGKELSRGHLANAMKSKRMYIRDNWKMVDNHGTLHYIRNGGSLANESKLVHIVLGYICSSCYFEWSFDY